MLLSNLLSKLPSPAVRNFVEHEISHITHDSRRATKQSVFVAIYGNKLDGRKFIEQCQAQVIIVDREPLEKTDKVLILVENARRAMALAACELFGHPSKRMHMIGLTGTNGKTTSCWMLEHILRSQGQKVGVVGTLGHQINGQPMELQDGHTTPESSHLQALLKEMVDLECHSCIMEVSSIGLEMARVDGICFDVAAFTNFTQDHLDFHSTMDAYLQAKRRLFRSLIGRDSTSILNLDQAEIAETQAAEGRVWYFGEEDSADWRLSNLSTSLDGSSCDLRYDGQEHRIGIPLAGDHNIENAVVAISAAHAIGISLEAALNALKSLPQAPGRIERVNTNADWHAFVDYAHTPDALEKVMQTLSQLTKKDLIVVFGCGGDRDRDKRPMMGRIASRLARRVIVTSDNPRGEDPQKIIDDIADGVEGTAHYIVDRREAIRFAVGEMKPGDVLLVAGKGHEDYQIIGTEKKRFDDRQEIMEALCD